MIGTVNMDVPFMSIQLVSLSKGKSRAPAAPKTSEAARAARKVARDEDAAKHRLFSEMVKQTKIDADELLAYTLRLRDKFG